MKKPSAKDRILATAGELFFQRGYSGVGINEIIEKAGTAKASFYQHYPSKEALCEAWLKSLHEQSAIQRKELLDGPGTPREKILAYFSQLETFLLRSQFRGCPYSNTGADTVESSPGIAALIRTHKEAIRQFFRDLAAQASPRCPDSCELGDRLFILYSGATSEAQNLKETWPVHVARAAAAEMVVR
ncbi:MAG TPA: TetR/AcrR family transcriptional regulator [Bacteroidia bacterium]|nr:TetR/AcrR family transcriptional regulator [Bacteroidia bacterium]